MSDKKDGKKIIRGNIGDSDQGRQSIDKSDQGSRGGSRSDRGGQPTNSSKPPKPGYSPHK